MADAVQSQLITANEPLRWWVFNQLFRLQCFLYVYIQFGQPTSFWGHNSHKKYFLQNIMYTYSKKEGASGIKKISNGGTVMQGSPINESIHMIGH